MSQNLIVPEPETVSAFPHDVAGEELREVVRDRYGAAARSVREAGNVVASGCCGGSCGASGRAPVTSDLSDGAQPAGLPAEAVLASLGCGNPTALAALAPGEVVLDLGSGGGIDVLLSARRVGLSGRAYGLDMTDEMLELARENQRRAGVENVEFLKAESEAIPLPDGAVDVVLSNCVINLSADKPRALAEAFRVLKPGGRLAVSDIVLRDALPEPLRQSVELWIGCVAGALEEGEYRRLLAGAGFTDVEIEPTRGYRAAHAFLAEAGIDAAAAQEVDGKVMSAFVRGRKPAA